MVPKQSGLSGSSARQSSSVTGQTSPSATATNPVTSRGPRKYFGGPPLTRGRGHVLGSGENEGTEEMDVERVNVEVQPSGPGVNDDIHHQDVGNAG